MNSLTGRSRLVIILGVATVMGLVLTLGFLLIVGAVLIGGIVGGGGCGGDGGPGGGSQQVGSRIWSGEQTANAQLITSVVIGRALPRRAAVIAVATAIVESGLRNLPTGDRDSLGLFQQRPSQGWGTSEHILTPALATAAFLDRLLGVPGWATFPPGLAEQTVQRSAFPDAYAPQEGAAADLVTKFWTGPDVPIPLAPGTPSSTQLASLAVAGCPDQGGSNIPLGLGDLDAKAMPPGYQLPADPAARAALAFAVAQLGKPYVWGATGPNSFDCSGLVRASWAAARVRISRSTATQVHDGAPVAGLDQIQAGDLLFIPGSDGTSAHPGHVGIYAGGGLVINAYDATHGVIVERLTTWAPEVVDIRHVTPDFIAMPASNPGGLAEGTPAR